MATGYVNQGPDRRAGGWLGRVLAWVQRAGAFKCGPPRSVTLRLAGSELMLALTRRYPMPYGSLFLRWSDHPWYASFRAGWRYDANWGDANVVGYNPEPHIVGGAFPDVIIKLRIGHIVHY